MDVFYRTSQRMANRSAGEPSMLLNGWKRDRRVIEERRRESGKLTE